MRARALLLAGLLTAALAAAVPTSPAGPPARAEGPARFVPPAGRDRCPVCGMFVARYPDWIAEIVFRDGDTVVFDGVKDLGQYWLDMRRYTPGRSREEVQAVYVSDYYTLEPIDGRAAFYVLGSDVYGPMGKELIPFRRRADAEGFLADHKGTRILGFREIPDALPELLR